MLLLFPSGSCAQASVRERLTLNLEGVRILNPPKTNCFYPNSKRGETMRSMDLETFESIWPSDREEKIWPMKWRSWPLQ